ncbi:MAG: pyridoxamine 5'-phosphate oxidase family protein [Acholeplasmatales bacterium]|nr:pyridoxamine 5'-phosphate oxidase family protein [Acholeplasmatales bacterium]
MFREMRRFKQKATLEECIKILCEEKRGVLSLSGDDGYPYGIPLDFYYNKENNKIYFHGAKEGHKIDSIKRCDKCSFTLWDKGVKNEGEWFYRLTSVIVFGRIRLMEDSELAYDMCKNIGLKYNPSKEDIEQEMIHSYPHVQMLELSIEHISGKHIKEE